MLQVKPRVLIVEARRHDDIADALLKGARAAIEAAGAEYDVVSVPGPLEIPPVVAMAEEGGHRAAGVRYDGYVALGCVARGEAYPYEIVAHESARGLMDLAVGRRIPIGFGILTAESAAKAARDVRSDVSEHDLGGRAARDCLEVIAVRRRLLGQIR